MEYRECEICRTKKPVSEFYLNMYMKPTKKCRPCCDHTKDYLLARLHSKRTIGNGIPKKSHKPVKKAIKYIPSHIPIKTRGKNYDGYIDEMVEKGEISFSDGEFYKRQNAAGQKNGGGAFHGRLL